LSSSSSAIALLFAWLPGDLHVVVGVSQSEAEVQLRGSRIRATQPSSIREVGPHGTGLPPDLCWTAQWSSAPQSPWFTQSVTGSSGAARSRKSWSLWKFVGRPRWSPGAKSLAGAKTAPEPMAVFQIELLEKGSSQRSRQAAEAAAVVAVSADIRVDVKIIRIHSGGSDDLGGTGMG